MLIKTSVCVSQKPSMRKFLRLLGSIRTHEGRRNVAGNKRFRQKRNMAI
jgi:hypothetical protein